MTKHFLYGGHVCRDFKSSCSIIYFFFQLNHFHLGSMVLFAPNKSVVDDVTPTNIRESTKTPYFVGRAQP